MKLFITSLFVLSFLLAQGQCEPDTRFAASATLEFTNDLGFIAQGGITGQLSPASLHLGIRAREFVDTDTKNGNYPQAKLFPRLEIGYRIINGVHLAVGVAKLQDISIIGYARVGEKVAVSGRVLYDGSIMVGMGVKILFYSY